LRSDSLINRGGLRGSRETLCRCLIVFRAFAVASECAGLGAPHMKSSVRVIRVLVVLGAVLAPSVAAFAQEAVLSGTITDSTGAVLPGVTVQAVHEASGNNYEAVTDARGVYRIPVRVGSYKITAQLTGFGNVMRTGVELLVGQTITMNLQMAPSTLQETVTVTGEAPLIETQSFELGGN